MTNYLTLTFFFLLDILVLLSFLPSNFMLHSTCCGGCTSVATVVVAATVVAAAFAAPVVATAAAFVVVVVAVATPVVFIVAAVCIPEVVAAEVASIVATAFHPASVVDIASTLIGHSTGEEGLQTFAPSLSPATIHWGQWEPGQTCLASLLPPMLWIAGLVALGSCQGMLLTSDPQHHRTSSEIDGLLQL